MFLLSADLLVSLLVCLSVCLSVSVSTSLPCVATLNTGCLLEVLSEPAQTTHEHPDRRGFTEVKWPHVVLKGPI